MRERVEYYTIQINSDEKMSWVYCATNFQSVLNRAMKGQSLKKVFVSLYGYLASQKRSDSYFDFIYSGGTLLLVAEHTVLELVIHAGGMMEYRLLPICEVNIPDHGRIDYPPHKTGCVGDRFFYDLGRDFNIFCLEQEIEEIMVQKTDAYAFPLDGFDEDQAAEAEELNELPQSVRINMENGMTLNMEADIEYFYVQIEDNRND